MDYLYEGFINAFVLLIHGHEETYDAVFTTVRASSLSILLSLLAGLPLGFFMGHYEFPGRRQLRAVVDTLLALPTVVVGPLLIAILAVSRCEHTFGRLLIGPSILVRLQPLGFERFERFDRRCVAAVHLGGRLRSVRRLRRSVVAGQARRLRWCSHHATPAFCASSHGQ